MHEDPGQVQPPAGTAIGRLSRRHFLARGVGLGLGMSLGVTAGCRGRRGREHADTPRLRVMTYNLHHGEGVDGRVDLERIAAVIRGVRPDLVALQEVDRGARRTGGVDQGAEYVRRTGMQGWFGAAMPFQGGEYGQMLLSRWPLEQPEVIRLPGTAGREPRIAVVARVRVPGVGWMRWAGCHLDASRSDEDRWEQAGALTALLDPGRGPILLAGDLNATPASRVLDRLVGADAVWDDLCATTAGPTIPVEAPRSRIDFILGGPRGCWKCLGSEVVSESTASDHRPVVADLRRIG